MRNCWSVHSTSTLKTVVWINFCQSLTTTPNPVAVKSKVKFVHTLANLVMAIVLHTKLSSKNVCNEGKFFVAPTSIYGFDGNETWKTGQGLLYSFFIFCYKQIYPSVSQNPYKDGQHE